MFCVFMFVASSYLLLSLPPSILSSSPSFLPSLPPSLISPSLLVYPHPSFPPLPPSFLPSSLLFLLFYRPPVYVLPHLSHPFFYSPIAVFFLRVSLFPLSPSFSFFWSSPEFWNPEYCHPLLLKAWMHERKVWLQKNFVNSPLTSLRSVCSDEYIRSWEFP